MSQELLFKPGLYITQCNGHQYMNMLNEGAWLYYPILTPVTMDARNRSQDLKGKRNKLRCM